ncbi:MAG: heliorhodopsin HeR [Erysipelotrichaceae bacterium]
MEKQLQKLTRFNLIMGFFHLIQGLGMLYLASTIVKDVSEFAPKITQFYLTFNTTTQSLEVAAKELFTFPFGYLAATFLLLSAAAHFLISVPKATNTIYRNDLAKGINRFRWFEYALSSSIMIVMIATLFGIFDIVSLSLIFVLNASMNFFGLLMEQLNVGKEKKDWGPFIYGCIAGLLPWIAILVYMTGNADQLELIPWFVWAIVATYAVAFNTFPINMLLQYAKVGKWKDYLYGERAYIILSLVAKSILAWLIFAAALAPM